MIICGLAGSVTAQEKKAQMLKGWGDVTDPDGDCKIQIKKSKLLITVPGTLHDLNPRNNKINAPFVLQEIEGDFSAQVKVSGDFQPGEKSTAPNSPPFNGAGLLLWQDDKNYLRLERNVWFASDGKYTCHPPLFEQCQNGEYTNHNSATTTEPFFKRSTHLRFERRGDKITAALSHDGKIWSIVKEIIAPYSSKVKVGVDAINTSTKPFTVEFDELKLIKS